MTVSPSPPPQTFTLKMTTAVFTETENLKKIDTAHLGLPTISKIILPEAGEGIHKNNMQK
jgi:hypothetical protein